MRILYIQPGVVPPPADQSIDKLSQIQAPVTGEVLLPTWARSAEEIRTKVGPNSYPCHRVNQFTYHLFLAGRFRRFVVLQKIAILIFFLRQGLRLHRLHRYDCIVSYGWTLTGLAAVILKWITGAKLIVELGSVPQDAYRFNRFGRTYRGPSQDFATRLMRGVSDALLHLVVGCADHAKLLYPEQLSHYRRLRNIPASAFHDFVPVARVPFTGASNDSVLLVGAPWYVKGIDILVQAFRMVEAEFPNVRLQLLGFFPEQGALREMIGSSTQIDILKACPQLEALQVIANCGIFVLASRTEGAGRVLIEAMAAGKPIIASRVGGIPTYVRDGENGLLFESGNVPELAAKLRLMLSSPELRKRLGENGYHLAQNDYSEAAFSRHFEKMIELTVRPSSAAMDKRVAHHVKP